MDITEASQAFEEAFNNYFDIFQEDVETKASAKKGEDPMVILGEMEKLRDSMWEMYQKSGYVYTWIHSKKL